MEAEKRKRSEKEKNEERGKRNKAIGTEEEEEEVTEEKVEELFAILRRMQEAVKYFGEGWKAAVETDVVVDKSKEVEDDDKDAVKEDNDGGLDLNAEPEGEHGSHLPL